VMAMNSRACGPALNVLDLRSDTVTRPTPEMRRAMAEAEVGDDVYAEDPTVNLLEREAAELFGKDAALFVPTGCMGNLIAIKVWTHHGDEVICEERSHVNLYELASMSAIAGCMPRIARGEDGILSWLLIEAVIRPHVYYDSQTALICLENTHNMAGGMLYPTVTVDEICERAHAINLKVHLDGARVFNAAVALGDSVARVTRGCDSVMFCGSRAFIEKARVYRKMFGGGMRQAGVIAAAGLVALRKSPSRLHIDHENARFLAEGLAKIPQVKIDPGKVQTNIVICDCSQTGKSAVEFCEELYPHGVWAQDTALHSVRFVTHCDVNREGIERALPIIRQVAANTRKAKA
jgi:threonine aldolase